MTDTESQEHLSRAARADLIRIDDAAPRFRRSALISLIVSLLLWSGFATVLVRQHRKPLPPIIMERVIITKNGQTIRKVVTMKEIQKRLETIHKEITPPKPPAPHPVKPAPVPPRVTAPVPAHPAPAPVHPAAPPPPGAHLHVLSAPGPAPGPAVLPGGNAIPGVPMENQNPGDATKNPENYTSAPAPTAAPAPTSAPAPTAAPEPTATPRPTPTPEPTATPRPTPTPEPTPTPAGPTSDAEPISQVQPEIPDELKATEFKTFVRVRVLVSADGTPTPSLRTSSGNPQIDALVLTALRKWKWKPALKDGVPVESTAYFKFVFEVE